MRKPKVTGAPDRIWLQVGEIEQDCDFAELAEGEVTWCGDPHFDTDIEYRRVKTKRRRAEGKPGSDSK